jgi:hypothetical protein
MKTLTLLFILLFGAMLLARTGPPRPDRDDGMQDGTIIKQYARGPEIVYHSETLSFDGCTDSWNRLLDKFPELRPVVIEESVDFLSVYGFHCLDITVIEK